MTDDHGEHDDADAIELAEGLRTAAAATRQMFNSFLAEGFTEAQAMQLVRSWLHANRRRFTRMTVQEARKLAQSDPVPVLIARWGEAVAVVRHRTQALADSLRELDKLTRSPPTTSTSLRPSGRPAARSSCRGPSEMAEGAGGETEYVILSRDDSNFWSEEARKNARSADGAIRALKKEGTFVAVPARSFKPVTVRAEQTVVLKLEDAAG